MNIDEKEVFFKLNGKEYCDENTALAILLYDEVVFANSRNYLDLNGKISGETTVLFVICNDIFAWACAEGENLPYNEIENLYRMYIKDKIWGAAKWCCMRRNLKPQKPVVDSMKESGSWDDVMESLRDNSC